MRRIATLFILLAIVMGLALTPAYAEQAVSLEPDASLPVSPKFSEKQLKNGLTYYVRSNHEPENRAKLILVVKAGRVQEEDDQLGAAHFVEHMAFNGTKHFPGKEIDRFMESVGMGTCECYSGYTTLTETVYSFWLPTEDIKTLDKGLQVISDIAGQITFGPEEVERERGVIVEEWREGKGRARENATNVSEFLLRGSRYADRLTPNDRSLAEDLDRDTMIEFYRQWYRPDLMAVIVVGDFDDDKVEKLVRKHFRRFKSPKNAPEWKEYEVPARETSDYLVITDPDTHILALSMTSYHEAHDYETAGDLKLAITRDLAIAMLNYRLGERLFAKDPQYLKARVSTGSGPGGTESFEISVSSEQGMMQDALEAVVYEIGRAMQLGFTDTELQRNLSSILKSADDTEAEGYKTYTSSLASELMRHFLHDEPVVGIENEVALLRGLVPSITIEDVNASINELAGKDRWTIIGSAPEDKESLLPLQETIVSMLESASTVEVEEYVDRVDDSELLAVMPLPGKVESESRLERFDFVEWKLSNGATVVLKPTDLQDDEVQFSAVSEGGHSLASDKDYPTAAISVPIVISGGLGDFDALTLGKKLNGKSVSMTPWISELEEGFSGSSTTEDMETMFKLMYLYFTTPRKDEVLFDTLKKRLAMAVDIAAKQPGKELTDTLSEVLYNNHPRRVSLTREMIEGIELDRALKFYRDRFADAGDFTFFIVGDFDIERARSMVETYIGGLPSIGRQETWRDVGVKLPKGVIKKEVTSGTGEKASVMLIFTGDFQWSRLNALELSIASNVLENMLTETLREEMSSTYDVSVSSSASRRPKQEYGISIAFNCSPENVQRLKEAVFSAIEKIKKGEDIEKYMEPIISKARKSLENSPKKNSYWLGLLSYLYINGVDPDEYVMPEEVIDRATIEGVVGSARKHFDMKNYVDIVYYSGTSTETSADQTQ